MNRRPMQSSGKIASPLCAILAGVTVMAVELLASRWLAPVWGFTLTTWTVLISMTLVCGSLGAWMGGGVCPRVQSWKAVGACFLAAGLCLAGCGLAYPRVGPHLALLPDALGLALSTALIVGPPVLLVSMVFPLVVHLGRDGRWVGRRVGRLAAFSTLGSLAGTVVPGLWLIPWLGVRASALAVGGLLVVAGAILLLRGGGLRGAALLAILALGWVAGIGPRPSSTPGTRAVVESPYGLIELDCSYNKVTLRVNGIVQSRYEPARVQEGYLLSNRNYFELLPYLRPGRWRTLHVGLGAGLVSRCLALRGLRIENVEVNPALAALVRRNLDFRDPVLVGDGRRILRGLKRRYDFILLDVFHGESPAVHLMTFEAFSEVRQRLLPGGVACVHLIGTPDSRATASVARTLGETFPETFFVRSGFDRELQDLYLFASDAPLEVPAHPDLIRWGWMGDEEFRSRPELGEVLTDDRNPLEVLNLPLARALRKSQSQSPHLSEIH